MAKHSQHAGGSRNKSLDVSFRNTRFALEPRVLLDAAAVETLADVSSDVALSDSTTSDSSLIDSLGTLEPGVAGVDEAVFIDGGLDNANELAASLEQPGRLVVLVDSEGDGLAQIRDTLADYNNLSAIHIVSHGADGRVQLGGLDLTSANIDRHADDLSALGGALAPGGDIRLYGCEVAASDSGQQFIDQLASLAGADVAASDDITGVSGDWTLEYQAGDIEASTPTVLASYLGDLALEGADAGVENGGSGDKLGWSTDASGEWVVSGGDGTGTVKVWQAEDAVGGTTTDGQTLAVPSTADSSFGKGVAISGHELVVAAPTAGTNGNLYVYQLDNSGIWQLQATIELSGLGADIGPWNDGFGGNQYIDISDGRIAVGVPQENDGGGAGEGRVAWVIDDSANRDWSSIHYDDASDPDGVADVGFFDEPGFAEGDSSAGFGASVSIAGDYLVVGAPGADNDNDSWGSSGNHGQVIIYSWTRSSADSGNGPSSSVVNRLVGNADLDGINGGASVAGARFGSAVDMEFYEGKYTIVVGAPGEGNLNDDSGWNENGYDGPGGEIYIYQSTDSNIGTLQPPANIWGQTSDGADDGSMIDPDRFGSYLRVSEGRILVGAKTPHPEDAKKVVWYYESIANDWTTLSGLDTNDPASDPGINAFALTSIDLGVSAADLPGRSLAFLGGSLAAVGAYLDDDGGADAGQVIFRAMRTPFALNDTGSTTEDAAASFDITANDIWGSESLSTVDFELLTSTQSGAGTFVWNGTTLEYDPGNSYQYLAEGESETVSIRYRMTDQDAMGTVDGTTYYFSTTGQVTITINGANDAVTDGVGLSPITVPQSNEPENASSPQSPSSGTILIRDNVFTDVDASDDLLYSLVGVTQISGAASSNPAITVNGNTGFRTGAIDYDLTGVEEYTQFQITIRADDGNGSTHDTTFVFTVGRSNESPEMTGAIPNGNATEDSIYTQDVSSYFTDPDFNWTDPDPNDDLDFTEKLTYSITSQSGPGPDWLAVGGNNGVVSGVPTNDNVGNHTVIIRATDIFGNYVESSFDITVANTNDAPVLIQDIGQVTAESGTDAATFSFDVTTVNTDNPDGPFFEDIDPTGDTITYTAELLDGTVITSTSAGSGEGSWIRFDGTTFTGTPDDPLGTTFTVRLIATDNHGASTTTLFDVGVFPPTGDSDVLTDGGASAGSRLGWSSTISSDGNWAAYGAPGTNGNGAVYIFEYVSGSWTHRQTIDTGMAAGSRFGTSVSLDADGDRLVVGAPMENSGTGAIYYFERSGSTFAASATAKAVGSQAGERLGSAVAVNEAGNNVLAGAPLHDGVTGTNTGAAHWYGFGTGSATQTLRPTMEAGEANADGDMFGISVAFDQNMLVVGAARDDHSGAVDAGSVYVFSTDDTNQSVKLFKAGEAGHSDYFGASVSVDSFNGRDEVILAVGAAGDDTAGSDAGAVYIYRSASMVADNGNGDGVLDSLVYQSTVLAYDAQPFQGFGSSVSVDVDGDNESSGIRLAVGGDLNGDSVGAAYGYRYWSGYGWVGQRYEAAGVLDGSSLESNQHGFSVAIGGTNVAVGAPSADRNGNLAAGLAYQFSLTSGETEVSPLSDSQIVKALYQPMSAEDSSEDEEEKKYSLRSASVDMDSGEAEAAEATPEVEGETGEMTQDEFLFSLKTLSLDTEETALLQETGVEEQATEEKDKDNTTASVSGFSAQLNSEHQTRTRMAGNFLQRLSSLAG